MSDKRLQRIWSGEGLRVPTRAHERRRLGGCEGSSQRQRAIRPNEVWSYEFIQERTACGRRLKLLPVGDEYTRECLSLEVGRRMQAGEVVEVLRRLVRERGVPLHLQSDNGPALVAAAVRRWLKRRGIGTLFITPGSPWENAFWESFNSRLRDEILNIKVFASGMEAKVLSDVWRRDYNEASPNWAPLGDQAPAEFASRWRATVGATRLPPLASAKQPESQTSFS